MNPIEILSAAPRGTIAAREARETGGGAEGAAEAFALLLEELSGGVARPEDEAGPDAEGEAGEAVVEAVAPDAPEGGVDLPDAVTVEVRPDAQTDVAPAPRSDAGPAVEPASEDREGDAPAEAPEVARRGVASRVAEALWNAVFGIAQPVAEGEVPVAAAGEPTAQVVPRAEKAELPVPVVDDGSKMTVAPARPEILSTGGPGETEAAEASEGRVPPVERVVAEVSRPVQAGGMLVAAPPAGAASPAVPPEPKADAEDGGREPGDPTVRDVTAERVAPVAPVPLNAAPGPGAVAQSPVLVEAAASPALEGWRLEGEPGVRTGAAEAAAAARPMPPAQQIVAQLSVAIQRAPGERVEIRLDPPELGRVQIELSTRDGVLHATVISERPEVHDLMRRHAEMLREELAAAGHAGVRLEFATGSGQGEGGREAEDPQQVTVRDREAAGPAAAAPVENPINRQPRVSGGRLDIRL